MVMTLTAVATVILFMTVVTVMTVMTVSLDDSVAFVVFFAHVPNGWILY